jgi:chloramphenicol-sensitive protein RarD
MSAPSPRTGFTYALGAYLLWGAFPIYFKALKPVPALEILSHRILWSAVFLAGLVTLARRWPEYWFAFRSRRRLATYALSTALVTTNWLLYIWAVNAGRVLEASLGYFVNPLVNVLLGVVFLRETLRPRQAAAVALATLGVLVLVARVGAFPWVALALAFSFGGYGLVRKKADIDPVVGLLVETSLMAPLAALLIGARALDGSGGLGRDLRVTALLLVAGVVTAVPLIWFAKGVRSLKLSTMGLIQYVTPTLQFLCAVVLFHEAFTRSHALAFGCIWVSLAVFSADALMHQRAAASSKTPSLRPANEG